MHRASYFIILFLFAVEFGSSNGDDHGCVPLVIEYGDFNQTMNGIFGVVTCNDGYRIELGNAATVEIVECQSNGTWTDEPRCNSDHGCDPLNITNGNFSQKINVTEGTKGAVTCDYGYMIEGSTTVECQEDGRWTEEPWCNLVYCFPLNITNGNFNQTMNVTVGIKGAVTCDPGYMIEGNTIVECQSNGSWTEEPWCNLVTPMTVYCSPLVIPNGNFDRSSGVIVGTIGEVTCDADYMIEGNAIVECQDDGSWFEVPECNSGTMNGGMWIFVTLVVVVIMANK